MNSLTEYKDNPNFHIHEMLAKDAQGLPYARAIINEKLLTNPGGDFLLQPGQVLIAFGSKEQLNILWELLGNLVVSIEPLK